MENIVISTGSMHRSHIHDECGVVGVYLTGGGAAERAYYGLVSLQHRGQESCGICVCDGHQLRSTELKAHKGMGLVQEVFHKEDLAALKGNMAIGHVRYSTAGSSCIENAQPFVGSSSMGSIAVAHNGQLVNYRALREMLQDNGATFSCTSDTEVILKFIARYHRGEIEISTAMRKVTKQIKGSYALCILTETALIGVRDPCGIRPLVLGKAAGGYALASESCALDAMGASLVRDVQAGEIIVIDKDGLHSYPLEESRKTPVSKHSCIFEYVYFSRPDSIVDGISVQSARINMGRMLAKEDKEAGTFLPSIKDTVVVGVPDSGLGAAEGYALQSGIPSGMGIIKNKYIGRSFIAPTQTQREELVAVKLNAVRSVVGGKRVIVIDDSIVRGTTSRRLVALLRKAGAKEVHFRVSSPEVLFPCYFGIDTPSREELVSAQMTNEELCREIGADTLSFLSLEGMCKALRESLESGKEEAAFCEGCFTGKYPMEVGE